MVEQADTMDLKSIDDKNHHQGSTPCSPTN